MITPQLVQAYSSIHAISVVAALRIMNSIFATLLIMDQYCSQQVFCKIPAVVVVVVAISAAVAVAEEDAISKSSLVLCLSHRTVMVTDNSLYLQSYCCYYCSYYAVLNAHCCFCWMSVIIVVVAAASSQQQQLRLSAL